jgi:hypothetical protein
VTPLLLLVVVVAVVDARVVVVLVLVGGWVVVVVEALLLLVVDVEVEEGRVTVFVGAPVLLSSLSKEMTLMEPPRLKVAKLKMA